MATAKCRKCGGSSTANTYEQARKQINHAVGLSRGIKCGDNYNCVQEIKPKGIPTSKPTIETKTDIVPEIITETTETKPVTEADVLLTKPKEKKIVTKSKKQTSS